MEITSLTAQLAPQIVGTTVDVTTASVDPGVRGRGPRQLQCIAAATGATCRGG